MVCTRTWTKAVHKENLVQHVEAVRTSLAARTLPSVSALPVPISGSFPARTAWKSLRVRISRASAAELIEVQLPFLCLFVTYVENRALCVFAVYL